MPNPAPWLTPLTEVTTGVLGGGSSSPQSSASRVIFAASAGNALEWYDFSVFGYFAPQIAGAFFPHTTQANALLLTFGTFGVSFLARPVGAAILGSYADRHGRRASLTLSIMLMTLGTFLMAAMPGYRSIGMLAPVGILSARLIQGFSAGGEFGGATAFMIEHAPQRAGFFGSFQFTSQALSAIFGSGVGWALSGVMSQADLNDWGFRLPFLVGLLIGPVGLYVRRHVDETPAFRAAGHLKTPARDVFREHPLRVFLGACLIAAGTAGTYLNIYLPTFASRHLHMASSKSFAVTFAASLMPLFITPFSAHLSDRLGRVRVMLWPLVGLLIISVPAFLFVVADPVPVVLAASLVLISMLRAGYSAPMAALLAELFPVGIRATGMSLAYTLGVVSFGGFAQLGLEGLIDATGSHLVPGYYMMGTAAITLASLLAIQRLYTLRL